MIASIDPSRRSMKLTADRLQRFTERGVTILSPESTLIGDEVVFDQFEEGVTIYPSVTIVGARSRFGSGTSLGKAGGGYFEDVATGRDVELFGGYFKDCVLLDGVTMRGHAEVRGGTLLEEGCEGAHHVGYKMTVMLPWVVAGSLVNFCDAFVAGGRSRKEHSEIGSTLALYNYSPWGDKSASMFGDVPRGVFLREDPIFIGGQTQIVSPVRVGFGAVIPAGAAVRRDVPDGRMYGQPTAGMNQTFDRGQYGSIRPKLRVAAAYIANLRALRAWYHHVRYETASSDPFHRALYEAADRQLQLGIAERTKRAEQIFAKLPASLEAHRAALAAKDDSMTFERRHRRVDEHEDVLSALDALRAAFEASAGLPAVNAEQHEVFREIVQAFGASPNQAFVQFIRDDLDFSLVKRGQAALQQIVDEFTELFEPAL